MCACEQGTCPGGCSCGCAHMPVHFVPDGTTLIAVCGTPAYSSQGESKDFTHHADLTSCRQCQARFFLPDLADTEAVEAWLVKP